ncbi:MAG: hypothetical protein WCC08_06745, partial [Terrimicrobiaceae bacterium]
LVLHGYVRQRPMSWLARGAFAVAALTMAVPNPVAQYAAIACAALLYWVLHTNSETPAQEPLQERGA